MLNHKNIFLPNTQVKNRGSGLHQQPVSACPGFSYKCAAQCRSLGTCADEEVLSSRSGYKILTCFWKYRGQKRDTRGDHFHRFQPVPTLISCTNDCPERMRRSDEQHRFRVRAAVGQSGLVLHRCCIGSASHATLNLSSLSSQDSASTDFTGPERGLCWRSTAHTKHSKLPLIKTPSLPCSFTRQPMSIS